MFKKRSKIMIMILTLLICISAFNIPGFATESDMEYVYDITDFVNDPDNEVNNTEENTPPENISEESIITNIGGADSESTEEAENIDITTVEFPQITVSYSYHNDANEITSSTSFIASYNVDDGTIKVKANAFPEKVKIHENDFIVIVNDKVDITSEVGYDNETGIMNIPVKYNKTNIEIEFRLPEAEITEVAVNGKFVVTDPYGMDTVIEGNCICASNSSELRFPVEIVKDYKLAVSALQGDIDLYGKVALENDQIIINTSPMGGNISGHLHSDYVGKKRLVEKCR